MAVKKKAQAKRKPLAKPGLEWVKPLFALVTVVGSVAGLMMLLSWMKDPYRWPVQTVRIEGKFEHLQQASLQDEVTALASGGFFALNVGAIQEQIERLPWVEQASVRRVWPDQLRIRVQEQKAIAHWGGRGFLNPRAEIFEPEQGMDIPGLPRFEGPGGYERRVLVMYQRMQEMLQPLKLSVNSLRLDARRAWRVQLSNGLTVEMGRRHSMQRVARFVRVYPAILAAAKGQLQAVDLRYSNGFAVRWHPLDRDAGSTG